MTDSAINLRILKLRIEALLSLRRMTARRASLLAKLNPGVIGDILSGRSQNPSMATLAAIADVLTADVEYLLGKQEVPRIDPDLKNLGRPMPIVGTIEAGMFSAMTGPEPWLSDGEFDTVMGDRSQAFPRARHFAFRVRGDSMNAAKGRAIVEGDIALCIDVIDAEIGVINGEIYAVRRTLDGGQTFEWTLKRAHVFPDRIELRPESTNPTHKPLIVPRRTAGDLDGVEVAAIGLVYSIQSRISRFS